MANETNIERGKTLLKALSQGQDVERAVVERDGTVIISKSGATIQSVDVADVDLLLSFSDGTFVIIPNGALDAISDTPHTVIFNDSKDSLSSLFKMVGISNHAKAGSLRVVSENIDAAQPPGEEYAIPSDESLPETPIAPAPMAKLSSFTGKGPGLGGSGLGEGEVPATVSPMATPQPTVYRIGQKSQQTIEDLLNATGLGMPNITTDLYTSSEYKVTPSGRTDLPLGAYDPNASTSQLAERISPTKQATIEAINGTSGNDTINFNPAFSSGEGQWSKTLHIAINNFSDLSSIQLVFNAARIAQIPGFELVGLDGAIITRDSSTSNSWHVTPTSDMLLNGVNVAIVYNVNDSADPVDFGADVIINGHAGPFEFELTNNLNLTWRDAVTPDDFTVTSLAGDPMMVLPSAGVGVVVNAGDGNDTISTGAGPDLIHGGNGDDLINAGTGNDVLDGGMDADTLNGGAGSDTSTYENATSGVAASLTTGLTNFNSTGEAAGDTYSSIENLTGSNYNDRLIGDSSTNILNGGDGDDVLEGMGSADTLIGGTGSNTASYAYAATGVTASLTTPSVNTGDAASDTYTQIQNLTGSVFNDTLIGDSGDNILNGGDGNDVLEGMGGSADNLIGGAGNNTASYEHAAVGVTASLDTPGINTGDAVGDTYTQIQNLTGSVFSDTLVGDSGINILNGGDGDDVLEGMVGADRINGGSDIDTASYAHASTYVTASLSIPGSNSGDAMGDIYNSIENLTGSDYNDILIGDSGSNILSGGIGDDVLEGMGGVADTLIGGTGNNTASYEHASTLVSASLTTPSSNTGDAAGDSYIQIQNLTGSAYNDILIGDSGNNTMTGGNGNDVLEGMSGADVLNGDGGIDTASYAHAGTSVTVSLTTTGINSGDASGDSYSSIENLTGSDYNDILIGDSGSNILSGGGGDDVLEGMGGGDTLIGGTGNNTASYENASALVTASLTTSGINTGDAAGDTYTQMQNLTGSAGSDILIGDSANNILNGGGGDDVLEGMSGGDILFGGTGNNTASYEHASVLVTASLTTPGINTGDAFGDRYTQIQNLAGSVYNDILIGDSGSNVLNGGDGDDVLEGMSGGDVMIGGTGNNTASYENASALVTASLTTPAVNIGDAAGDTYTQIQNLTGSTYNDTLIGDGGSNTLSGGAGNDILEGMGGADILIGGIGSNTASYEHASVLVTASLTTPGINTGDAMGDTYTEIQNLTGSDFNDNLVGDGGSNILIGGDGDDILEGMGNADTLVGGNGIDTASYAHASNYVVASLTTSFSVGPAVIQAGDAAGDTYNSIERLIGSDFNDTLIGNSVVNSIFGGAGDDVLEGIGGGDTYDGGTGSNTVSYAHAPDVGLGEGVTASLLTPASNLGAAFGDIYTNIQNLAGSDFDDTLTGNANNNILNGGAGNDTLYGGAGTDTIYGGLGNDNIHDDGVGAARLYGEDGDDTFHITSADTSVDIIDGGDKSALRLTGSWAGSGDTISWEATTFNRIDVDMMTHLIYVRSPVTGNYINFTNVENFTVTGNNTIYITLDNYSNTIDATSNGTANIDYVFYQNSLGSLDLRLAWDGANPNVTGGSSVLDNFDAATSTWTGSGDTLKGIERVYNASYYADNIYGSDGVDNWLAGSLGADYINGGTGTDTVYLDPGRSQAVVSSLLTATQNTQMGIVMSDTAQGDIYVNMENIYSSGATDQLYGNSGDNVLSGNGLMEGFRGADNLVSLNNANATASYANAGDAYLAGQGITTAASLGVTANLTNPSGVAFANGYSAVSATSGLGTVVANTGDALGDTYSNNMYGLKGSAYNDILIGNALNNTITGGDGNDLMEGLGGADSFIGGNGTDTVSYAHSTAGVVMDLGTSGIYTQTGDAAGDTYTGVENIIGSTFNDTLAGNSLANVIEGGLGNDYLDGGANGNGYDVASYANASGAVTVSLSSQGSAQNTVNAGNDTLINMEGLLGSIYNDILTGNSSDNWIDGGDGADTLNGGAGVDTLSYASATSGISITLNDSNPTLTLSTSNTQGDSLANFENLVGSDYNDTLNGDSLSNVIEGGLGNDILNGGANSSGIGDTASYANAKAKAGVTVSLANLSSQNTVTAGWDTLSNFENLTGSDYEDTLTGDNGSNIISGGNGNDLLYANAFGAALSSGDTLAGGNGTDTVSFKYSGTVNVTINGTAVHNGVTDTLTGIENLVGSAYADTINGDGNDNVIDGGEGDDYINGGAGNDTVTYVNASGAVTVNLGSNSFSGAYGTSSNLYNMEHIIGSGYNDTLTGNNLNNTIEGGAGNDWMDGGTGTDTASYSTAGSGVTVSLAVHDNSVQFTGGAGNDILYYNIATNQAFENLTGSAYNDFLTGDSAANTLDGGAGDDVLNGGFGADILIGGAGNDTASYAGSTAVTVNLTSSGYRGITQGVVYSGRGGAGDALGDTYNSIENVTGSDGNDTLMGTTGNNVMAGGLGDDLIYGDSGNDIIYANQGRDTVYGEANNDTLYVSSLSGNLPTIIDGGARDAGNIQNHGGNVMVLQDLVNNGSYNMTNLASLNSRLVNIDTLNIRDGASTAITFSSQDIQNMVDNTNASQLFVEADSGDTLFISLAAGQTQGISSITSAANGSVYTDYTIFNSSNVQVAQVHWHTA